MVAVKARSKSRGPIRVRGAGNSADTLISIDGGAARLSYDQLLDLNEIINERLKFLRILAKVNAERWTNEG